MGSGITQVVDIVTGVFTGILGNMSTGVVDLFEGLLYAADGSLTAFAQFAFLIVGLGLATGIFYTLVRVIKR